LIILANSNLLEKITVFSRAVGIPFTLILGLKFLDTRTVQL
jgi:hypothetical protein